MVTCGDDGEAKIWDAANGTLLHTLGGSHGVSWKCAFSPDGYRVVTVSQVVQTQVGVNRLMAGTSWFVLGILVVVGGASLASAMAANVRERRREIGTLMAIGATPGFVLKLFLMKAMILGVVAGTLGCLLGLVTAIIAGPQWAGVEITPLWSLALLSIVAATVVAVVAAWFPARQAAKLDPCLCFQEV